MTVSFFPAVHELVFFSALNGILTYRVEYVNQFGSESPEDTIRRFLRWGSVPSVDRLLHSTSWRFDSMGGCYVFTWAITPDVFEGTRETPVPLMVLQGIDALHPSSPGLTVEHSVAHAARHLSFLLHTDSVVRHALHHHLGLHDALLGFNPTVAGNPH